MINKCGTQKNGEMAMKNLKKRHVGLNVLMFILGILFLSQSRAYASAVSFFIYNSPYRNVTSLVNMAQSPLNNYQYDTFGNIKTLSETVGNNIKYVGEQYDKEAGLVYLRNRYYDPNSGRFISKDILKGSVQNPQTINPYPYCVNNAVNFIDPLGLFNVGATASATVITPGVAATVSLTLGVNVDGWNSSVYVQGQAAGGLNATGYYVGASVGPALDFSNSTQTGFAKTKYFEADVGRLPLSASIGGNSEGISLDPSLGKLGYGPAIGAGLFSGYAISATLITPSAKTILNGLDTLLIPDIYAAEFAPAYGGVSLNKTASLMLNVQDIAGAKFDPATGQVILYGKKNVGLPQMKLDDLSVAVSSVYGLRKAAQDPGVSIGTEASDVPGQMKVRYDGDTANTAFGITMFDSDRLLKTLSMGKDNITGAAVTSSVSGYKNMLDRYRAGGTQGYLAAVKNPTNRMWFTPQEVKLSESVDGDAMLFDSVKMQLLTESTKNGVVGSDPFAEAFASHFTANYDAFAAERPILQELKRLGKMTAVVKWIKDNNIPFDLSFFKNYTPEYHATTGYTPQTSVTTSWRDGMMFYTLTITGGVVYRLDASNFSSTTNTLADTAGQAAVTTRPAETSFSWDFSANGQAYTAIAPVMPMMPYL